MAFWTAFWVIVPPIVLLAMAFVKFFRDDFNDRLGRERQG